MNLTEHEFEMMRERLEQLGIPQPPRSSEKGMSAVPTQPKAKNPVAGLVAPRRARFQTKTEEEFEAILRTGYPQDAVLFQALKFRIGVVGGRCWFSPDFVKVGRSSGHITVFEVKGPFVREDSTIKFKAAAEKYPFCTWEMHQRQKDGTWRKIH